jgi:hypothetical protein
MVDILAVLDKGVDFLSSDNAQHLVTNILLPAGAAIWMWVQRVLHINRQTDRKWDDALLFIEAGVAKTYQAYVKTRKAASADGTLTEDEKKEARQTAFNFARQYAAENGVNLVKEVGAGLLPALIEKAVGTMKREASGPTPIILGTGDGNTITLPEGYGK